MDAKCRGQTKDGRPCGADAWRDGWCRWHSPDPEMQRCIADGRRKGGHGKATAARVGKKLPADLKDVQGALLRALAAVEGGDLDPQRANSMAAVARAYISAWQAGELEQRVAALESAADLGRAG